MKNITTELLIGDAAHGGDFVIGVGVLRIETVAGRDQHIWKTIEIDVHEQCAPGPFACVQAAQLRDFGVRAVAAIQKECVALDLRAVFDCAGLVGVLTAHGGLAHAARVIAAEHVEHKKVIETVAVDVCEIHSHGKRAGVAHGYSRQRSKMALTVVKPNAIRTPEIVAHVKIGTAIAIHVVEHCGEAPIFWRGA